MKMSTHQYIYDEDRMVDMDAEMFLARTLIVQGNPMEHVSETGFIPWMEVEIGKEREEISHLQSHMNHSH